MQNSATIRPKRRMASACIATMFCALTLVGCSKTETPEQRVRALIDKAEQAVEKKEIRELRGYVSDRYSDDEGRDRRTVDGILRLYLLRHETIHLLTRIDSVRFPEAGEGEAIVYVAMAGRPIVSATELAAFRADLFRFEIGFAEEDGDWRIVRAAWRRAEPADFIYQN